MTPLPIEQKHPLETLDYSFDFSDVLTDSGDTVSAWDVGADDGISLTQAAESNGVIRVFASGGANKRSYVVAADIATASGRIARKQMLLRVRGQPVSGISTLGFDILNGDLDGGNAAGTGASSVTGGVSTDTGLGSILTGGAVINEQTADIDGGTAPTAGQAFINGGVSTGTL